MTNIAGNVSLAIFFLQPEYEYDVCVHRGMPTISQPLLPHPQNQCLSCPPLCPPPGEISPREAFTGLSRPKGNLDACAQGIS